MIQDPPRRISPVSPTPALRTLDLPSNRNNPKFLAKSKALSNISEKSSPKLARKQHSHEVSSPSTSLKVRKRLIPGLPHPDTLRLQVFSTS